MTQEKIALAVVAVVVFLMVRRFYRKNLVKPLSEWFLRRGQVGIAMRIRYGKKPASFPKIKAKDCC